LEPKFMSLAKQEFTNAGRNLLGQAQAGQILNFTNIVVGSGSATQPSDLWPLTALITPEMTIAISSARDLGNGIFLVEGNFRSDTAPHAFYLRELGVMAYTSSPTGVGGTGAGPSPAPVSGTAQLYSVANVFADPPDYIDPAAPTVQSFKIKLIVDRVPTSSVVVSIGPSEAIMGQNIGSATIGPGPYQGMSGNVMNLKRFVAGPGIALTEDVPETGSTITIAAKVLTANVDLYVPLTYPGAPVGSAFPDIQAAHDYLKTFRIPSDKIATIHVWTGTFTYATTILFDHPDSSQIHIVGQARIDKTFNTITYINATTKQVNPSDITGVVPNLRCYLPSGALFFLGGAKVISSAAGNVRLNIEKRDTRATYTGSASTGAWRLSWFPTIIICSIAPDPNNPLPAFSFPYGIGSIENLTIDGGWASVSIQGIGGVVKNCQLYNSVRGINAASGAISLQGEVIITQCLFGVTGPGSVTAFEQTYISACTQAVTPSGAGYAMGSLNSAMTNSLLYLTHNIYAMNVGIGANFLGGSIGWAYNDYGLYASTGGIISITNAARDSIPLFNGDTGGIPKADLMAQGMSYVYYEKGASAPTCNPAAEVVGNQNALIHLV
jgi:hypothetical protein